MRNRLFFRVYLKYEKGNKLKMLKKSFSALLCGLMLVQGMGFSTLANGFKSMEELEAAPSEILMYRLYNPNSGEHFYTKDDHEKEVLTSLGWKYEGVGWYAPFSSNTPVYRLYNNNAGDHHYTTDKKEKDTLVRVGWKDEGISWYSDDQQRVPLYRVYNPNAKKAGAHHYTTNVAERNSLVSQKWIDEGIAWYGIKEGLPVNNTDPTPNTPTSEKINLKGNYVHSSGAGAWGTELTIDSNNHFFGDYQDSNYKEVLFCKYSGDIVDIQKVGDKKYTGKIANLKRELPNSAWLAGFPSDVKVKEIDNPSFKNGDTVMIYLAGYPISQVSDSEYSWMVPIWGSSLKDKTPGIFITNLNNEWSGFCGYDPAWYR